MYYFGALGLVVLRYLDSSRYASLTRQKRLTLVVALSGRTTEKCGKNHSLSDCGSERDTTLMYPFFKYSSITP